MSVTSLTREKDEVIDCSGTNSQDTCAKKYSNTFLDSRRKEIVGFQYLCASQLSVMKLQTRLTSTSGFQRLSFREHRTGSKVRD